MKLYYKYILALTILINIKVLAQVPYEWPVINSELTPQLGFITQKTDSLWKLQGYNGNCTSFGGNLELVISDIGYSLFMKTPSSPLAVNPAYENYVLEQVDTMLMMMDSIGYKVLEISIGYPVLCDSFPNHQVYLDFYKRVYTMAHKMGFKIIDHTGASNVTNPGSDSYLENDVKNFYYNYDGILNDTLNTSRFLYSMTQMKQTVIDSLTPDYLTLEVEPETMNLNLLHLVPFNTSTTLLQLEYFLTNLKHKGNILFGAGAGTWDALTYFENYASIKNGTYPNSLDYLDYHMFMANGTEFNPEAFQIDSIAKANGKRLVIGECNLFQNSDSEYNAHSYPGYWANVDGERDKFDYFEGIDTMFQQAVINLSQLASIDMVNFYPAYDEFGYITWQNSYSSQSATAVSDTGEKQQKNDMFKMQLGPLGIFTQKAIAKINCKPSGINTLEPITGISIYPNPASEQLLISFDEAVQCIEIDNLLGQSITELKVNCTLNKETIDISNLSSGIYFVKLLTEKGYSVKKFVKE
ncbi:MAG: T9SS type A sorting domain-containing protein [Bacteroidia bacterium]